MNNKCVYVHKLNGEVVYVGSGTEERSRNIGGRSDSHIEVWDKLEVEIVSNCLSSDQSVNLEQELISKYWNTGKLLNKSKTVAKRVYLEYEMLNKYFYLDANCDSGIRWKVSPSTKIKEHCVAGTLKVTKPYYVVQLNKQLYQAHRIVWCLHNKSDLGTDLVIDHIDGNSANNSTNNLRSVTQSANTRNKKHKGGNTGEQCIYHCKKDKYFIAYETLNGKRNSYLFSYNINSQRKAKNLYETCEGAFTAALAFRNFLVQQGKIILT